MRPRSSGGRSTDDRQVTDYLLGRLAAPDRALLEERFFADDDFADRMFEREDDLLDELAAGTLGPADERALVDRLMCTPEGARRAAFARALHQWRQRQPVVAQVPHTLSARRARGGSRTLPQWLAAAAMVTLATAAGWLGIDNARLRQQLRATLTTAPPVTEATVPRDSSGMEPRTAAVTLSAERTRSSSVRPVVELDASVEVLRLSLLVQDAAEMFDATVETSPGGTLVSRHVGLLKSPAGTVDLWIAANQIANGEYEALLSVDRGGRAALVAQYVFRVVGRDGSRLP